MPKPKSSPAGADVSLETLRADIEAIVGLIGAKALLHFARQAGHPVGMDDDALRKFARRITVDPAPKNREALQAFLRSPLGRLLRNPQESIQPATPSDYDRLAAALLPQNRTVPPFDCSGLYFFYHGSYIMPRHYAVRLLEIRLLGSGVCEAYLFFRDNVSVTYQRVHSRGYVTFFEDRPQILLESDTYRTGYGLILIRDVELNASDRKMVSAVGDFTGMTKEGSPFHRFCFIVRDPDGLLKEQGLGQTGKERPNQHKLDQMYKETGLFTLDELSDKHRAAIDQLAKRVPAPIFDDAIRSHPKFAQTR